MAEQSSSSTVVALSDPPLDPSLAPDGTLARECPRYVEMVRRARALASGEGFADIEALDVFRIAPWPDKSGRPVVIFLPAHLPDGDERLLELATLFVFSKMHQLVCVEEKEFTALWLCNNRETPSPLYLRWWRRIYWATPYVYHQRLSTLAVVHPSVSVRVCLFALSYVPRVSFWEKLDYMDRIEFLDQHVPVALIKSLPQEVKDHDKELDREMYDSVQNPDHPARAMAGMGGLAGAGGLGEIGGGGFGGAGVGGSAEFGGGDLNGFAGLHGARSRHRDGAPEAYEMPKRNWEND